MLRELWLPITGYEKFYKVSNWGRILRKGRLLLNGKLLPDKMMRPYTNSKGYVKIGLLGGKTYSVSRLVAFHFIPNPNNLPEVNHIDLNKQNNRVCNLEWTTAQGNMDHYYASGQVKRGKTNAKILDNDIAFIRENYVFLGPKKLAKKFNVHVGTIVTIAKGRGRKAETPPCRVNLGKRVLDTRDGTVFPSAKSVAIKMGISPKALHRRLNGERKNNTPFIYAP